MIEDIFSFDDFLTSGKRKPLSSTSLKENFEEDVPELINKNIENEESLDSETFDTITDETETHDNKEQLGLYDSTDQEEDDFYKLYGDKNEEFVCDIMIEGSSPEETCARIIIESENWSLIFPGEIRNGKCIVPIKKLNILKEGEIGNIKLEVIAEGNLFIPWENKFKVKMHKKVTVMMNENKSIKKPIKENKIGIKVNLK